MASSSPSPLGPQTRYEALRAYLLDGVPAAAVAERFGYTSAGLHSAVADFRAGAKSFFLDARPGPRSAPGKDAARTRIIALRAQAYSIDEIAAELVAEDYPDLPADAPTRMAGLLLALPDLLALDLPALVTAAGYPGTRDIPAINYLLGLLAVKLTGTRRVSHVGHLHDPGRPSVRAGLAEADIGGQRGGASSGVGAPVDAEPWKSTVTYVATPPATEPTGSAQVAPSNWAAEACS